jgi:hypothetical protein
MRLRQVIDRWLASPYIKGVVRRLESLQPLTQQPFEEELPSERTITQSKTIRLLSPPTLETCDIFKIEPAFGRLPNGSRRTLLFDEPVAGLPGWQLRRAPCFFCHRNRRLSRLLRCGVPASHLRLPVAVPLAYQYSKRKNDRP